MTEQLDLWERLVSFGNLAAAARNAARGKRSRPDVAAFLLGLEDELIVLQRQLGTDSYRPGPYRTFNVREGKRRLISAAPFRDRVVHHALTQVAAPLLERRFSTASFACRRGYGTHRALARARAAVRRFPYVLKCDVVKYFASIDHDILMDQLRRAVPCPRTLELARRIVAGSNPQENTADWFPGDGLFTPWERRRGLPLGNQTSQFFANVYLTPLDHMIQRRLRPGCYVRYVDDLLLFGRDLADLRAWRTAVAGHLGRLRLRLHPGKSRAYRCGDGVTFLGFRLFPDRVRLDRGNVVRFRRRLRTLQRRYAREELAWADVTARVRAWLAHAEHGDTWRLRRQILAQHAFCRGSAA